MASKGKKRKGTFNSSSTRKRRKVIKINKSKSTTSTSTVPNKPSLSCSTMMIPPGYPNTVIIRLTKLKICANCNCCLSDENNFPFTGSMSYINTCTVAQALSIVYPEEWKDLDKINLEDKYLCIECISALNKIYKTFVKFKGLASGFKKTTKYNDNDPLAIDDDNELPQASPVQLPEHDDNDEQNMSETESDFRISNSDIKIKSEYGESESNKEVAQNSKNKNPHPHIVFVCPKCSNCLFRSKKRAIGHIQICGQSYDPVCQLEKLDYIYCKYSNCLKSFKTTAAYKEHLNEAHKMDFNKLNCGICGLVCQRKRNLLQHFQVEHPSYEKALIFDTETCERMAIRIKSKDKIIPNPKRNSTSNSNKSADPSPNKTSRPKRQSANYSVSLSQSSSDDTYDSDDSYDGTDKEFRIKSHQRNGVTSSSSDSEQTENNTFTCTICNLSILKSKEDLQAHRKLCQVLEEKSKLMDMKQPDEKPITLRLKSSKFVCQFPNCSKVTNSLDQINCHMAIHSDFCPWRCGLCSYKCRFKSDLRLHLKQDHDEVEFRCTKCIRSFKDLGQLKEHEKASHQDNIFQKMYRCKKCPEQFSSHKLLEKHEITAHIVRPVTVTVVGAIKKIRFKCPVCNISMTEVENLRIHMTSMHNVHPFICTRENCNTVFKSKLNLNTHIASEHENESSQEKEQVENHTTLSNRPNSTINVNTTSNSLSKNSSTQNLDEEFILGNFEDEDNQHNQGRKLIGNDNVIQIRVVENLNNQ